MTRAAATCKKCGEYVTPEEVEVGVSLECPACKGPKETFSQAETKKEG